MRVNNANTRRLTLSIHQVSTVLLIVIMILLENLNTNLILRQWHLPAAVYSQQCALAVAGIFLRILVFFSGE